MPFGLDASDRKLLLIGGGLLLLMLVATILLSPPGNLSRSSIPSTFSPDPQGAEAAYVLLEKLHDPVRRWENPPDDLPSDADDVLLILADPTEIPTRDERRALANFVRRGGRLLFTGRAIHTFFPEANLSTATSSPRQKSFSSNFPSYLDRGVNQLLMTPETSWGKVSDSQLAVYGPSDSAVVVAWAFGSGEIVWWAGPTPLTNAGISRADNLLFFLDSISQGAGVLPYQIYWDEYFHGERSSLLSYVGKTSLPWGFAQIGLVAFAALFTFSRRSGPIWSPSSRSRLSPLEFVDTLGGLYERADAAGAALGVSRARFRFLLVRQLGLRGDAPDSGIVEAAAERLGWNAKELADLLARTGVASGESKLPARQALSLVREIEQRAAGLAARSRTPREKN
jgi:Domain of unknown function (DUF4350)